MQILIKGISNKIIFEDFQIFFKNNCPGQWVVHDLLQYQGAAEHPVVGRYSAVVALIKRCLWDNPLEASVQVLLYMTFFMGQKEYTVFPRIVSSLKYFSPLNSFGSKNFLMINSCLLWIVSSLEHLLHFPSGSPGFKSDRNTTSADEVYPGLGILQQWLPYPTSYWDMSQECFCRNWDNNSNYVHLKKSRKQQFPLLLHSSLQKRIVSLETIRGNSVVRFLY